MEPRRKNIKPNVVKDYMKAKKVNNKKLSELTGIPHDRIVACLKKRQTHKFTDEEIISVSISLGIPVREMMADGLVEPMMKKLEERRRIIAHEKKFVKEYRKFYDKEEPKVQDCRKMISNATIVKAPKLSRNPLNDWHSLEKKPKDPGKEYVVDQYGMEMLRCHHQEVSTVIYLNEYHPIEDIKKMFACLTITPNA